jgi:hypothetical protein
VCAECGFPAIVSLRRCPFCRTAFPRARRPAAQRIRLLDPLAWLAIAWVALMIPAALLTLVLLGSPLVLLAAGLALAPAGAVWLLRGRTLARIRRLNRRARGGRAVEPVDGGQVTGSEQPPRTRADGRTGG